MREILVGKRIAELWRFYGVAAVNSVFGYGAYFALLGIGLNLFVAQILAQILGASFNYVTYSRHVFRDAKPSKSGFVLAYGLNYVIGVSFLALFHGLIPSPYISGGLTIFCASVINYVILRNFVFKRPRTGG